VLAPDPAGKPIAVTVFYPTAEKPRLIWVGTGFLRLAPRAAVEAGRHPLVVISHGTGGGPLSHLDTALALAGAGYVVAAPMHNGDNLLDQSEVGTSAWFVDRSRQIARVNDYLLRSWPAHDRLDASRIGLFGFSAGGTTALIAIGGALDLARVGAHCREHPEFACTLMRSRTGLRTPAPSTWTHDPRVRAAVVAAPGLGFAFEPNSLPAIQVPVQLWQGGADASVPPATNADVVRRGLPVAPEFHLVENAGHFAFLTPCGLNAVLLPKMLCVDPRGFDRSAFHERFNASVVGFLDRSLGYASDRKPAPAARF
jgi:predicted dienelactone hydrolase